MIHPVPDHQDLTCQHIEWMGEDLAHCPGVGEWKCLLQKVTYGDLLYGGCNENTDYEPCNHHNHEECPIYLKQKNQR